MATGHQSPQSQDSILTNKTINTFSWGAGGNTSLVVVDPYVHPNSMVMWHVFGTSQQTGNWSLNKSQGQFNFISSDPENSALTIAYIVL